MLGWRLARDEDDDVWWMSETGREDSRPLLVFLSVPQRKTVKIRVHIDVSPSGCEQDEELARLLAMGATRVDIRQGDVPWVVLADPEGNEFCLLRRRAG